MSRRTLVVVGCLCILLPGWWPAATAAEPAEGKSIVADLAGFPRLQGQVKAVLGSVDSFVPPVAGDSFRLELKDLPKLTKLTFGQDNKHYVPLPAPVTVDSTRYYTNGSFQNMRLVARQGGRTHSVTIDVVPAPGTGPNRVRVWVTVQSNVVAGVILIECEGEGTFPDRAK